MSGRTHELFLFLALGLVLLAACSQFDAPIGIQTVGRDAFPVLDDPEFLSASEAEELGMVGALDPVIGIVIGGEAKAYPIDIMGIHELGNDTIGGIPIAVTW